MTQEAYYSEEMLESIKHLSCAHQTMKIINSFSDIEAKIETNTELYSLIDLMDFINNRMPHPVNDELFFWLFSEYEHGIELNKTVKFLNDKLILMLSTELMDLVDDK